MYNKAILNFIVFELENKWWCSLFWTQSGKQKNHSLFDFASLSLRYDIYLGALQGWVDKGTLFKIADVISKLFISNRKLQDDI